MEDAVKGFDIVISKYPKHEKAQEALYIKAWALMDLGREEEGIASLQQLVNNYPKSTYAPHSYFSIADYYYNLQDYQQALTYYQKVVDDYPESEVAVKVPDTITELKESIAYIEYEKAFAVFSSAREMNDDPKLYSQAAEMFLEVAEKYPYTESEIGAYSNAGMCFEEIEEWQRAADAYDQVIKRYEEGAEVALDAFNFARMHKQYIVANKL